MSLLDSVRSMDPNALTEVFDLYAHSLYCYALRICNDPFTADQIVGDVFAKLLEQLSIGNGPQTNLRSYLYEMTYHRTVDEMRYSQRIAPMEDANDYSAGGSVYQRVEENVVLERVLHSIRHDLTEDQRHVIILRFLEGMNIHETASILGKAEGYIKVIQNRAIAILRKRLNLPTHGLRSLASSADMGKLAAFEDSLIPNG